MEPQISPWLRARADYRTSVPGGVLQLAESAEFLALRRQQRLVLCQWSSRYVRKIDYRDLDIISSASIRVEQSHGERLSAIDFVFELSSSTSLIILTR